MQISSVARTYSSVRLAIADKVSDDPVKLAPLVFLCTMACYSVTVLIFGTFDNPDAAYYPSLANSFLHHRLDVEPISVTGDLTEFGGKWFVPFPPLPAVMMLPQAALLGYLSISTVIYSVVLGSLSVTFVFLALAGLARQSLLPVRPVTIGWLTSAFGFGTVNWYMSLSGTVWFLAQVAACATASLALVLAIWLPLDWAALGAGAAVAVAVTARPTVLPYVIAVIGIVWLRLSSLDESRQSSDNAPAHPARTVRGRPRAVVMCVLPPVIAIGVLAVYNYLRFASPLEFGYSAGLQNVFPSLAGTLARWGQFSPIYIPQNIWAFLFSGLTWNGSPLGIRPDPRGLSILLTSSFLVYLWRGRKLTPSTVPLWLSIVVILLPILLYYNTGWNQFGYRFSLDFLPLVMLLLGAAFVNGLTRAAKLLILFSVAVNLGGAIWWLAITAP